MLFGIRDRDTSFAREALIDETAVLPPIVLAEALSNPMLPPEHWAVITSISLLTTRAGYWQRTGELRAELRLLGAAPKIADALVAQSCIDHDVPLITYDHGFRRFIPAGLKLVIEEV